MDPEDAYVTRGLAARITGAPSATIAMWRARGWMSTDADGNPVRRHLRTRPGPRGWLTYHYGDLLAAERDTRLSGHSRRRYGSPPNCRPA